MVVHLFNTGKYLITSLNPKIQEQLYWELFNVLEFIKENPDNYNITIEASESTITNYDTICNDIFGVVDGNRSPT